MRFGTALKTVAFYCARPAIARELPRARFIFIVTAMRCGSSLLQHLIAQDPEIDTMGEAHIRYRSETDLMKLIAKTRFHNRSWRSGRRVFLDKLTQTNQQPPGALAEQRDIRFVFLIRDPIAAAASLLQYRDWPHSDSPAAAAAYYVERLESMRHFAEKLAPTMALAVSYETLKTEPEHSLSMIGDFVGASQSLRTEYPTRPWTGEFALSDVSDNIHSGRILKSTPPPPPFPDNPGLRRALDAAHKQTLESLAKRFASTFH